MAEQKKDTQQIKHVDDQISLRELLIKIGDWKRYLLSKARIIILVTVLGGVLGFIYSLFSKPSYKASMSFVLEEQKGGGSLGSMSDLASLVGISLGGSDQSGLFSGDNIMEFIKSKRIIGQTLLTKAYFDGKEQLLAHGYVKATGLKQYLSFHFVPDTTGYVLQDSLLSIFHKQLIDDYLTIRKPDKKLAIIQLDITSTDEAFAKAFCEALMQNVTDFYVQTRTKKSAENLAVLTRQVDSVRHELNAAITGAASATQANPNPNPAFQTLRVASQRKQVDVQVNSALLGELIKQQEVAKLNLQNSTPLIQVVDVPTLPLAKKKTGKVLGGLIGMFFGAFFVIMGLSVKRIYQDMMQADKPNEQV